jgi:hypothetical protein
MQKDVIVFGKRRFEQTIERQNFKAFGFFLRIDIEGGEHGLACEFHPEFFGDGKSVISDPINSSRDPGHNLEKRSQIVTVDAGEAGVCEFMRASAVS